MDAKLITRLTQIKGSTVNLFRCYGGLLVTDITDPAKRSRMMAGIKSRDTKPEQMLRQLLFNIGFRYRLHVKRLPGTPDLWFARYRSVIEINGCFWHGHNCHLFKWPTTRESFWREKINENRRRDASNLNGLTKMGIRRLTVWECALKGKKKHDPTRLSEVIGWWLQHGSCHAEIEGGKELVQLTPYKPTHYD